MKLTFDETETHSPGPVHDGTESASRGLESWGHRGNKASAHVHTWSQYPETESPSPVLDSETSEPQWNVNWV